MKLDYIKYVLEISKTGSINKASENLYLSQPYLSKCLKELEAELGIQLIERSSRGVSLTEYGEEFIEYASMINHYLNLIESIGNTHDKSLSQIKIACFYSFTLMNIINKIIASKIIDNINLKYYETQNFEVFEQVKDHKIDLGIMYLDSISISSYINIFIEQGLVFDTLIEDGLYAVVSKNHPLYNLDKLNTKQLKPYNLIMETYKYDALKVKNGSSYLDHFFNLFTIEKIDLDNNSSLLYHISTSSTEFTIGQKIFNADNPLVKYGEIKYIPITDLDFTLITGVIYKKEFSGTSDFNELINLLKESINSVYSTIL